jgi:hypothetical protein
VISLGPLEKMDRNFAYTIGNNYSVAYLTYMQINHYTDYNFFYLSMWCYTEMKDIIFKVLKQPLFKTRYSAVEINI